MSAGDESGRHARPADAEPRTSRSDPPPATGERRTSARPPAISGARPPAIVSAPPRPDGHHAAAATQVDGQVREVRQTTRMTTDEIAALMQNPPITEDFDAEKTIVVDERRILDEHSSIDDSPTIEGDGRVRNLYEQAQKEKASSFAPPRPVANDAPAEVGPGSEGAKRRTSRRTVRIPDDAVERPEKLVDRLNFGGDESEEVTIVRPLRIIDIGSDPPPAIRSAEASWPPRPPPNREIEGPASAIPTVAAIPIAPTPVAPTPPPAQPILIAQASSAGPAAADALPSPTALPPVVEPIAPPPRTDPLPRNEAYDVGWTPAMPPVVPIEERPSAETELGQGDFEEVPDSPRAAPPAAPPTAPKKPPPPPKHRDAKADAKVDPSRAPTPIEGDMKNTAVDPGMIKRPRAWFEELFGEDYLRTMDKLAPKELAREVDFIEESLSVEKHAVILDLACGRGEITCSLAGRGYTVLGVDLSPAALAESQETARDQRVKPSFLRADMRELDFEEAFDATVFWGTSFGYFDEAENVAVLKKIHRALRQGGMLLLDVANRDYVAPRSPSLVWFEGDGCVCMDDMSVDFLTSRLRVKRTAMFDDGHSRELEYSIRLYSLNDLGRALHEAGFKVIEVTGHLAHPGTFFGTESPRLIVLAERS